MHDCRRSGAVCTIADDLIGCAALPAIVHDCRRHVCSVGRRLTATRLGPVCLSCGREMRLERVLPPQRAPPAQEVVAA